MRKTVLIAALCGAVVGVIATRVHLNNVSAALPPFFSSDHALSGHRGWLLASVAAWAVFGLYWDIAAKNAAKAKSSESKSSRGVHVVLVNVALLLEILPIHGLGRLLPVSIPIMAAGIAMEAIGLFLAIWARRHLGSNWSGEITIKVEHQLIRTGPYRLLRHPIYTGLLAMYLGIAMVFGEWLSAVGLALAVFAYWRKIHLEEENLRIAFGDDYAAYCDATWALVPGIL